MRHKLLVLTVKKFLQSVYIYGSYRKIKTGVPFFCTSEQTESQTVDNNTKRSQTFAKKILNCRHRQVK